MHQHVIKLFSFSLIYSFYLFALFCFLCLLKLLKPSQHSQHHYLDQQAMTFYNIKLHLSQSVWSSAIFIKSKKYCGLNQREIMMTLWPCVYHILLECKGLVKTVKHLNNHCAPQTFFFHLSELFLGAVVSL